MDCWLGYGHNKIRNQFIDQNKGHMVSPATIFGALSVLLTYLVVKNSMLDTSRELQEEIEKRIQPRYPISEPLNSQFLGHTDWPSEDFYFEVWHVEVQEARSMRWKKWLPGGNFRGSTSVKYEIHGPEPPNRDKLTNHHLGKQPYIRSIRQDINHPNRIRVIYNTVDPSQISLFVKQFKYLLRDTTFYQYNPDANLKTEFIKDEEGNLYAHLFDENVSGEISQDDILFARQNRID